MSAFPRLGDDGVKVRRTRRRADRQGRNVGDAAAPRRLAEPFERLRDTAGCPSGQHRQAPAGVLACLGDLAAYSARATWTRNFLAAGGIEAIAGESLHNSADAGKAFAASGATLACICSSDPVYAELAEATAGALKAAGARQVLLAGRPKAAGSGAQGGRRRRVHLSWGQRVDNPCAYL